MEMDEHIDIDLKYHIPTVFPHSIVEFATGADLTQSFNLAEDLYFRLRELNLVLLPQLLYTNT